MTTISIATALLVLVQLQPGLHAAPISSPTIVTNRTSVRYLHVNTSSSNADASDRIFGCMYQCSPGGHHMDRGACFYNGCPSASSSDAADICFGAAGNPFGHDRLEFHSVSACTDYIRESERTSYSTRSSAMREFFELSSTGLDLDVDADKPSFLSFLKRAHTVYTGALNAVGCYHMHWRSCANLIGMLVMAEDESDDTNQRDGAGRWYAIYNTSAPPTTSGCRSGSLGGDLATNLPVTRAFSNDWWMGWCDFPSATGPGSCMNVRARFTSLNNDRYWYKAMICDNTGGKCPDCGDCGTCGSCGGNCGSCGFVGNGDQVMVTQLRNTQLLNPRLHIAFWNNNLVEAASVQVSELSITPC